MALLSARVATHCLVLSAGLAARLGCVFAIIWTMTVLPTEMRATLERLPAYLTAARICKPAGHIFQHTLTAQTRLLGQKWTFRTAFLVCVAGVWGLRMATSLWTLTREVASRRLRSTWLRRIQNRPSAIARNLFKDCLSASIAGTLVAKLRTCVPAAFQRPTTYARTYMLCLDVFLRRAEMRPDFAARSLPFVGPLLSWTTSFSAGVPTTV